MKTIEPSSSDTEATRPDITDMAACPKCGTPLWKGCDHMVRVHRIAMPPKPGSRTT